MSQRCLACTRPAHNHRLCEHCTGTLARLLGDVPALLAELAITEARLDRIGGGNGGSRSTETRLPWSEAARDATWVLGNTLTGWVRELVRADWPADTTTAKAAWLLCRIDTLADHDAADEALDEIHSAVTDLCTAVIDRPAQRLYAGVCGHLDCQRDLYARPGAPQITCPGCGHEWDVADRRRMLIDAARELLLPATELGRALTVLGEPITGATIRGWKRRGLLAAQSIDVKGRPCYLVGDVMDLVEAAAYRAAAQ